MTPEIDEEKLQRAKSKAPGTPLRMGEARELVKEKLDCSTTTYYKYYYPTVRRYAHRIGHGSERKRVLKRKMEEILETLRGGPPFE